MRKFAPSFDGRRGLVPPQTSFNVTSGSVHCQTTVTPGSESGHSEGSKNSYMDQCTFGAVRLSGGRPAARRRPPQKSWRAEGEMRPFPVEGRSKWASGGRRPPSCLSPPLLFQQSARWAAPDALPGLVSRAAPFLFPVSQSGLFFLKLLFFFQFPVRAADADSRITAAAIPPRPDRQTEPGRTPCSPTSRLQ
jgi:hypothetical protein